MKHSQAFHLGLIFILSVFLFPSCEKTEGEGGTSVIMGRVKVKDYNNDFSIKFSEYYSEGVDVYIIYGKDSIYSDDFETGLGGWYRFKYLTKGEYKIYAMSKDSTRTSPSGLVPVMREVFINENNSTHIVDDIQIFD